MTFNILSTSMYEGTYYANIIQTSVAILHIFIYVWVSISTIYITSVVLRIPEHSVKQVYCNK